MDLSGKTRFWFLSSFAVFRSHFMLFFLLIPHLSQYPVDLLSIPWYIPVPVVCRPPADRGGARPGGGVELSIFRNDKKKVPEFIAMDRYHASSLPRCYYFKYSAPDNDSRIISCTYQSLELVVFSSQRKNCSAVWRIRTFNSLIWAKEKDCGLSSLVWHTAIVMDMEPDEWQLLVPISDRETSLWS